MIEKFTHLGIMAGVREIQKTGKIVPMSVTLPEISSVSWSSFMTGTNPGKHGIFGFVDLKKGTYEYIFPGFKDLKALPFFDELGERRMRSVIINLPSTYPAREISGVLISGFVAPDLKRAVFPRYYFPVLEKYGYEVDIDATKGKDKKMEFFSDLHYTLKVRKQVADVLWNKEKWDLFMFTITGTDRLHHFLFDASCDETHGFHFEFIKYYQEIDRIIWDFFEQIKGREEFEFIMLSDHGFVRLEQEIYLNSILRKNGFFSTETKEVTSLDEITGRSLAFALDPSRIFIHLRDKFPKGRVNKNDYNRIRHELKQLFENYQIGSTRVIKKVHFKEEIYDHELLENAPDIVLQSHYGYDLKGGLKKKSDYGKTYFTGMHSNDNAFFFSTRPELLGKNMTIFDVKNHIFKLLNINI